MKNKKIFKVVLKNLAVIDSIHSYFRKDPCPSYLKHSLEVISGGYCKYISRQDKSIYVLFAPFNTYKKRIIKACILEIENELASSGMTAATFTDAYKDLSPSERSKIINEAVSDAIQLLAKLKIDFMVLDSLVHPDGKNQYVSLGCTLVEMKDIVFENSFEIARDFNQ